MKNKINSIFFYTHVPINVHTLFSGVFDWFYLLFLNSLTNKYAYAYANIIVIKIKHIFILNNKLSISIKKIKC